MYLTILLIYITDKILHKQDEFFIFVFLQKTMSRSI